MNYPIKSPILVAEKPSSHYRIMFDAAKQHLELHLPLKALHIEDNNTEYVQIWITSLDMGAGERLYGVTSPLITKTSKQQIEKRLSQKINDKQLRKWGFQTTIFSSLNSHIYDLPVEIRIASAA